MERTIFLQKYTQKNTYSTQIIVSSISKVYHKHKIYSEYILNPSKFNWDY